MSIGIIFERKIIKDYKLYKQFLNGIQKLNDVEHFLVSWLQ